MLGGSVVPSVHGWAPPFRIGGITIAPIRGGPSWPSLRDPPGVPAANPVQQEDSRTRQAESTHSRPRPSPDRGDPFSIPLTRGYTIALDPALKEPQQVGPPVRAQAIGKLDKRTDLGGGTHTPL